MPSLHPSAGWEVFNISAMGSSVRKPGRLAIFTVAAIATIQPAHAGELSSQPKQSFYESLFAFPGSSQLAMEGLLSSMSATGSSELPEPMTWIDSAYPLPTTDGIAAPAFVSKVVEPRQSQLERWTVASPSMRHDVEVLVRLPNDPATPAPMLYLLDGIDAERELHVYGLFQPGQCDAGDADAGASVDVVELGVGGSGVGAADVGDVPDRGAAAADGVGGEVQR